MVRVRIALHVARRFFISTYLRRCDLRTSLNCPEVGLRFRVLTFRDGSELESGIPKPTSGHLDRATSFCPEVRLRIPKPTSGHLESCRESLNFLVSRGPFGKS